MTRPLVAALLLLGSAGCAVPKDMSQSAGGSLAPEESAAARDEPAPRAPEPVDSPESAADAEAAEDSTAGVARVSPPPAARLPEPVDSPESAADAETAEDATASPAPVSSPPLAPARLLGRRRAEIERQTGRLQPGGDGWARHGELELQLRDGRCVRLRGHVPSDMDCADAATWLGYGPSAYPLRRADSCEWPGLSLKHRLAEGVAGRYVPATRQFELWLRGRSRGE